MDVMGGMTVTADAGSDEAGYDDADGDDRFGGDENGDNETEDLMMMMKAVVVMKLNL